MDMMMLMMMMMKEKTFWLLSFQELASPSPYLSYMDLSAYALQYKLIIMLSLGSTEIDGVISETLFTIELKENEHLGAKTWPCYIEICVIARRVIMRLSCTSKFVCFNSSNLIEVYSAQ